MKILSPKPARADQPKVVLCDATVAGGLRKYTEQLVSHLRTPCVIATAKVSDRYAAHWQAPVFKWSTVPHQTFPSKLGLFGTHVHNLVQLCRVGRHLGVPVVHIQDVEPLSTAVLWPLLKSQFKVVMSVHDLERHRPYSHGLARVESSLRRRLYRQSDAVFVFSRYGAQRLVEDVGARPERVHVIPLGLLEPMPTNAPVRRAPPERPVFLLFGSHRPNRGFEVLVDAFLRLRKAGHAGSLRIAGTYPEALVRDAQAKFVREGLEKEIEFINRFLAEEEIDGLMRSSDVIVLPYTRFESQSGVVFLAYAYNMPIVASRVGGLTEMIEADGTGVAVAPGSAEDLSRGLAEVMYRWSDIARAEPSGLLGSKYSWEHAAEQTDAVYTRLLTKG